MGEREVTEQLSFLIEEGERRGTQQTKELDYGNGSRRSLKGTGCRNFSD